MQVPSVTSFKAQKQSFIFQMSLRDCQKEPILTIELTHSESKQNYFLQLEDLSAYLDTPIQLYNELRQIFQDINIDSEGAITFKVNIGKTKKRTVKLKTQKKPSQIQENSELANLKEELISLKKQLKQQQQQINTKRMKELESINQLRALVVQQNRQIDLLNLELQNMYQSVIQKIDQNSHLGEAVSALNFEVIGLKTAHQTIRLQLHQNQQKIQIKPEKIIMNSFVEHPQHWNPFYTTKLSRNSYRIQKALAKPFWDPFIPAFKIFPKKKVAIKVRVTKTQKMQIMLGFCTAKLFGNRNLWKYEQTAALDFRTCSVWCNGKLCHQGTQMVEKERVVQLQVDLFDQTFSWRYLDNNKYTKIWEFIEIPKNICNQELYFYVLMCRNQEFVEIITD